MSKMTILETLEEEEQIHVLYGNAVVGVFDTLFDSISNTDTYANWKPLVEFMCPMYYLIHSGSKKVASFWDKMNKFYNNKVNTNRSIGLMISYKFGEKWNRAYETLIMSQYEALEQKTMDVKRTIGESGSKSIAKTETGDTQTGTSITVTTTDNTDDKTYGFNSGTSVPTDETETTTTETTTGNKQDNTTHNSQTESGTESNSLDRNEKITNTGRDVAPSDLIQKELDMRNRQTFFDIIYKDIDSVLALSIY